MYQKRGPMLPLFDRAAFSISTASRYFKSIKHRASSRGNPRRLFTPPEHGDRNNVYAFFSSNFQRFSPSLSFSLSPASLLPRRTWINYSTPRAPRDHGRKNGVMKTQRCARDKFHYIYIPHLAAAPFPAGMGNRVNWQRAKGREVFRST